MTFPTTRSDYGNTQTVNSTGWTIDLNNLTIQDGGADKIVAGDLIIINIGRDGSSGTGAITGYTAIFDQANGTACRGLTFVKVATAGDASSPPSLTYSPGASEQGAYRVAIIKNWYGSGETDGTGVYVTSTPNTGASANPDPPNATPTGWGTVDILYRAIFAHDDGRPTVSAYPTSYDLFPNNDTSGGSTGAGLGSAGRQLNSSSDDPGTFTRTGTGSTSAWVAWTVAIRPSSLATVTAYAQAQADIKTTYHQYAQAQADIKTTYQQYAQAQADIKQTYSVVAQAQAHIKNTYNGLAQAQADILATNNAVAQAQADILQVYYGLAQAQADILTTYYSLGQAQALITVIASQVAQAQGTILTTYYGLGQAQASIKTKYNAHAQALADIKQTYPFGSSTIIGQDSFTGSANILSSHTAEIGAWSGLTNDFSTDGSGRAYSDAPDYTLEGLTTNLSDGYAQVAVVADVTADGQLTGVFIRKHATLDHYYAAVYSSNSTQIVLYRITSSAWTSLGSFSPGLSFPIYIRLKATGQSPTLLYVEARGSLGALGTGWQISTSDNTSSNQMSTGKTGLVGYIPNADWSYVDNFLAVEGGDVTGPTFAQAQALISVVSTKVAQAQATIKTTYYGLAQAQADILTTYDAVAQAQGTILQIYSQPAQAQGTILTTYDAYAQAQGTILTTYDAYAQAQASILAVYDAYAQAQASILAVYSAVAQAQAKLNSFDYCQFGQAQAYVALTGNIVHGQAQAQINAFDVNAFGQAQADILQTYQAYAQAQALITVTYYSLAQSQATILQVYSQVAQSQASILTIYYVVAQAQGHILRFVYNSAQASALIKQTYFALAQAQATIRGNAFGQAGALIRRTETALANAQSHIRITITNYGQAQAHILATGVTVFGQAQAYVAVSMAHGQARAYIASPHTLKKITLIDKLEITLILSDNTNTNISLVLEDYQELTLVISDRAFD